MNPHTASAECWCGKTHTAAEADAASIQDLYNAVNQLLGWTAMADHQRSRQ